MVKVRDKVVSVLVNDLIRSYQTTLPIHYKRRQRVRLSDDATVHAVRDGGYERDKVVNDLTKVNK